jgi:hypothetical protein
LKGREHPEDLGLDEDITMVKGKVKGKVIPVLPLSTTP